MPDETVKTERPKAEPQPATPSQDETIDSWFRDHFAGTALAGTTELYNAAFAAKEDLKKRLAR